MSPREMDEFVRFVKGEIGRIEAFIAFAATCTERGNTHGADDARDDANARIAALPSALARWFK